jgi:hypothetical protein
MGGGTSTLEQLATERADEMSAHIRQLSLALQVRIWACARKGLPLDTDPMKQALAVAIVYLELERTRQLELRDLAQRVDEVMPDVLERAGELEAPPPPGCVTCADGPGVGEVG